MLRNIFLIVILLGSQLLNAQCKIDNNSFRSGEELTYDLYFKMGILNPKAGFSILRVDDADYDGQKVQKAQLIAQSTGTASKLFSVNDTITSYFTKKLVPLAFYKDAHEGGDYTKEKITYKYKNGKTNIYTRRDKNEVFRYAETVTSSNCVYDMLSVVFYARTLDYSTMKKGDTRVVEFMSGKRKLQMIVEHAGTERMKANDKKRYNCIKLILSISDDAFKDKEEAMKVYITNDANRMPVRIDSKLKVGSTQAVLKSYKGNLHPIEN